MKFAQIGPVGQEIPVVMTSHDTYVDIGDMTGQIDGAFLSNLDTNAVEQEVASRVAAGLERSIGSHRFGAPITRPHQVICIGLNFADHAIESGMPIPEEPLVFSKSPNCVSGPNDDVIIPRGGAKTDWEVELGVVIGQRCRYLDSPEVARGHIAGYVVAHDVSERAFQLERGGQWLKGKSCESFNPIGPWLVTANEVADVQNLAMWLKVNGATMQSGNTKTMIFPVDYLVWYLSQFMVLEPGDLINTGTPPGVGLGMEPARFLNSGDEVELGIEGLGTQKQAVIDAT